MPATWFYIIISVCLVSFISLIGVFGLLLNAEKNRQFIFIVGSFSVVMLPITAGGFIYNSGSDLVPELQKERSLSKSVIQFAALGLGATLMLVIA